MQVYDLAWSPTGEYIIAGSTDNAARVFAVVDGVLNFHVNVIALHSLLQENVFAKSQSILTSFRVLLGILSTNILPRRAATALCTSTIFLRKMVFLKLMP